MALGCPQKDPREGLLAFLTLERWLILDIARTVFAATVAWVHARRFLLHYDPILAPLGALLAVQVTARATLVRGLQLVTAVVAGVLIVVGLIHLVGLRSWALCVVFFFSLILGRRSAWTLSRTTLPSAGSSSSDSERATARTGSMTR